jgi:hypothetical protein
MCLDKIDTATIYLSAQAQQSTVRPQSVDKYEV